MTRIAAIALTLLAASTVACSDDPVSAEESPLAGLTYSDEGDSVSVFTPQPGGIRGTVVGPATASAGSDTVDHYPRLSGVVVTVYPFAGDIITTDVNREFGLGAATATATTDAEGRFAFPDLSPSYYVITFRPAATSAYQGVWVSAPTTSSPSYGWWIVLPRK